jgi:hypothetical protein
VKFKIIGGSQVGGPPLCKTCKNVTIVKGQNCQELMLCSAGIFGEKYEHRPIPFKVSECGDYHPINVPWLHEMKEMAWKIEARKRGPSGFGADAVKEGEMEVVVTPPKKRDSDYE